MQPLGGGKLYKVGAPLFDCLKTKVCRVIRVRNDANCRGMVQGRSTQVVRAGMFDTLTTSLEKAWDMVKKDGKLTADNIKGPMREIRRALLEADVSLIPFAG